MSVMAGLGASDVRNAQSFDREGLSIRRFHVQFGRYHDTLEVPALP